MYKITQIFYSGVDSSDFSCFINIVTYPPIPAEASFFVRVNGTWTTVFPNEINPGEYRQKIYNLNNGDNSVQFRVEYEGKEYLSETINVLVEGEVPEVVPPREPTPPIIKAEPVKGIRGLACKIKYEVYSKDPLISHMYSENGGKTWDEIQPGFDDGDYCFSVYYKYEGVYTLSLKVIDDYWDESEIYDLEVSIIKGEGDEPGTLMAETDEFVLVIAVPDEPDTEQPRLYYVVNCGGYSDKSIAEQEKTKLMNNGFDDVVIEIRQV